MGEVKIITLQLRDLSDTEKLGWFLGATIVPGDVLCLDGDLGAGKTTLAQSIARGLGVPEDCYVTSPSFAILHEYEGRIPMYHMDFYRLHDVSEVIDLGFEEYFYKSGVSVIEWSERAREILPEERLVIELCREVDATRNVVIRASSGFYERIKSIGREFPLASHKG